MYDIRWLPDGSGILLAAQEKTGAPQQIYWNAEGSAEARKLTADVNSYIALGVASDSHSFLGCPERHQRQSLGWSSK